MTGVGEPLERVARGTMHGSTIGDVVAAPSAVEPSHRSVPLRLGLWAFGVGLVLSAARMLFAPRIHDAALMEYLAWRIREGDVPYRDLMDMNLPGTYLLHVVGQAVLGVGDLQLHLIDLGVMALCAWAIWALTEPFPTPHRALAVMAPVAVHLLVGGPYDTLERDWVMAAVYLAAAALLHRRSQRWWALATAGALLGWATLIKPQGVMMLAAVPVVLAIGEASRSRLRAVGRRTAVVVAGFLAVLGGILAWVAMSGGWDAFVWTVREYLPLYSRLDRWGAERSLAEAVAGSTVRVLTTTPALYAAGALAGVLFARRRLSGPRWASVQVLAVVAAVGLVHGWSGFKLWRYHFAPLQTATVAIGGLAAFVLLDAVRDRFGARAARSLAGLGGAVLCAVGLVMAVQATVAPPSDSSSIRLIDDRVQGASNALRTRAEPGDAVQILDTFETGMNAALRARIPPATRYVYDFHFFHDVDDPVVQSLRRDFIDEFDAAAPRFVLLNAVSWGMRDSFEDVEEFPELADRLRGYRVVWEDDGLRLLERRG